MVGILVRGCRCTSCKPGVIFDFGATIAFSTATFETYFSYPKTVWIGGTDYFMYLYLIVLYLINRSVDKLYNIVNFSLQMNPVILLLSCFDTLSLPYIFTQLVLRACSERLLIFAFFPFFYISRFKRLGSNAISSCCGERASLMLFYTV